MYCTKSQDHGLDAKLDNELIRLAEPALSDMHAVRASLPIRNTDRTVGTMLGHEITKRYGGAGLPEGTVEFTFTGSAGQSFGAFVPRGVTLRLFGDANDYFGKGLSGGNLVRPSAGRQRAVVPGRGQHHRRQRHPVRGHRRDGSACEASSGSGSASATPAPSRWSRVSATTGVST